jgi:RND family efflux transporter MFP subunit
MLICKSPLLLCIALSSTVLFSGCNKGLKADPRTETQLVRLATVQSASDSDPSFTGVVTARVQSNLGFRVGGKVTERLVDTGQTVHAGQPLMRIDPTDYTHAITAQTNNVAAARVRAEQTAADEARYRGLVATGAASASTYDQIKAAADAARDQLVAAEAQAKVATDEGEYTTLSADADGVVVETLAEPGQVVTTGQTVIRLAHSGPREAAINLPEAFERPRLGSIAQAMLYSKAHEKYHAHLRQLSDSADPLTRTFEARYVLEGAAAKAPLGETVTILVEGKKEEDALEVPLAAIFDPGTGPGVWVFNHQKSSISFRKVNVLEVGVETAKIGDGLQVGDRIVALAPHVLHEGQVIRAEESQVAAR